MSPGYHILYPGQPSSYIWPTANGRHAHACISEDDDDLHVSSLCYLSPPEVPTAVVHNREVKTTATDRLIFQALEKELLQIQRHAQIPA